MLVETIDISLPDLPADLEGLRIAHLTDLHVRRPRKRYRALLTALEKLQADLTFLTGDYMCDPGDEPAAMEVLAAVCQRIRSPLGAFGVFGNHDSHVMRALADELPVRWLDNHCVKIAGRLIEVLGFVNEKHRKPDVLALLASMQEVSGEPVGPIAAAAKVGGPSMAGDAIGRRATHGPHPNPLPGGEGAGTEPAPRVERPLRLLLSHYPTMLPIASELNVDIMFSGHTHGGQWRLPWRVAPYTSCDLPSHLSAGILRHRRTLGAVARGIGETFVPLRILCPPQLPVYVLRRGPLPGEHTPHVENVRPW